MRRYLWTALLCLTVLPAWLLSGCGGSAEAAAMLRKEPPPLEEPAEEPAETLDYAVEMVDWEDSSQAEDGTELATCRFQVPELTVRRNGGEEVRQAETEAEAQALTVAEGFNSQFAAWTQGEELQELTEIAQADREWRNGDSVVYSMELACRTYQTERMVSVAGDCYSYTGGAHPNTVLMAWNFDLTTGTFFTPELLAEDGKVFSQAVTEELVRQIRAAAAEQGLAPEDAFWSNYEEIAAEWTSYAVSFDAEGMTVAFSPYELACYAAGPQEFRLPYRFLEPYLSEQGRALLGV